MKPKVLVIGDSHAQVFNLRSLKYFFGNYDYLVEWVGGATVSGLENPNSHTKTLAKLQRRIKNYKPDFIICLFGEVDCGFVIWHRAKRHGESIKRMFNQAVERYGRFLLELKNKSFVIVLSTPLPTLADYRDFPGKYDNSRNDIKVSQRKRTSLTLFFNRKIQEFCECHGIKYISLDKECLGDNGLVKEELINNQETDYHYFRRLYAKIIIDKFMEVFNEQRN